MNDSFTVEVSTKTLLDQPMKGILALSHVISCFLASTSYQLRPNVCIAMSVCPELFKKEHVKEHLAAVEELLMVTYHDSARIDSTTFCRNKIPLVSRLWTHMTGPTSAIITTTMIQTTKLLLTAPVTTTYYRLF
jgi:hypothetical protein